jgi:hypothetical protein
VTIAVTEPEIANNKVPFLLRLNGIASMILTRLLPLVLLLEYIIVASRSSNRVIVSGSNHSSILSSETLSILLERGISDDILVPSGRVSLFSVHRLWYSRPCQFVIVSLVERAFDRSGRILVVIAILRSAFREKLCNR